MKKSIISVWLRCLSIALVSLLAACGGGGGSPGSSASGGSVSGSNATSTSSPSLAISIVDSTYSVVTANSVSGGGVYYVQAVLTDGAGTVVGNKLVTFSTDPAVATLSQSSATTDPISGKARVRITPASLTSGNAGTVTANANISGSLVTSSLDYSTTASNVTLSNLVVNTTTLNALQSTPVTVSAAVNGITATSGQVTVNFSAGCGQFSPSSASTSGTGVVSTVYTPTIACSGSIELTASPATSSSASPLTQAVTVNAAQPTNVVFDSATPATIVTSQAATGTKQATVKFKVLNASGAGMSGQSLTISMASAAKAAGVNFLSGTNTLVQTDQAVTTDANGEATVIVKSGSLPTPVQLTATLTSALNASSSGLAVTSGVPSQNASSLAASKLSIEGWTIDGASTDITWRVADRQGNPVPQGTTVNFVTRSNGILPGSCTLDAGSKCTVTYTTAGTRPSNGRVVILAYMDGEESFVDANGNNTWDTGESFDDIGTTYIDENDDSSYGATEQNYPGGSVGASACDVDYVAISRPSTCDGTWSATVRVRQKITVSLASSTAARISLNTRNINQLSVQISDSVNTLNNLPSGTTVAASVITPSSTCAVSSVSPNVVGASPYAGNFTVNLNGDASCPTARIEVKTTTPSGLVTAVTF